MKNQKKIISIMIFSGIIMFSLFMSKSYAVKEEDEGNRTQGQNTVNAIKKDNNTVKVEGSQANNANLSNLGIKPYDFTGFKYGTTSYEVKIPENTDMIEVYATAQHEKATITGTGKKKLKKGKNNIEVEVTAEDGTKKIYTIQIIRGEEQEEKQEGLSKLSISGLTLSPEFNMDQYTYMVSYEGEETQLTIQTETTSQDYTVEVIGNFGLEEGENMITLLVAKKNGDHVATYQIMVYKSLPKEKEVIHKEDDVSKSMIGAMVAVGIIFFLIMMIRIKQKKSHFVEEYSETSLYDEKAKEELEEDTNSLKEKDKEERENKKKGKYKGKRFK